MQQAALEQFREPGAVPRVGLVPLQRPGVRRVDHRDLREVPLGQGVVHRLGIDAAGLHHHMGDAPLPQFRSHLLEHPEERPVLQDLRLAGPGFLTRGPDCDLDHVLVHVDPGDALVQHPHAPGHLLQRQSSPDGTMTRPPARARPVQETDTRARSSSGGYPERTLAPFLLTASNGPKADGDGERARRHHYAPSIPPPHTGPPEEPRPACRRSYATAEGTQFHCPRQSHPVAHQFLLKNRF